MKKLENKTTVVTGGGSGIGAAISKEFAKEGADVKILEVNIAAAEQVTQEITEEGGQASIFECDISSQSSVDDVFQQIGNTDILMNNAGISAIGNIMEATEEDLDRVYSVNVKGVFNCSKAAVPQMLKQNSGVILNMCSVAATIGIQDRFAYSMTKGAVLSMTYSIAKDYVDKNIRCNCICPARVHTPFVDGYLKKHHAGEEEEMLKKLSAWQPIGRMATPEEVAKLALFLCSDDAQFITGSAYPLDGGVTTLI